MKCSSMGWKEKGNKKVWKVINKERKKEKNVINQVNYMKNNKFLGKLQIWSLSFTSYVNWVPKLLIVSIQSLTFLVSYQFNSFCYLLDGKS